MKKIGVLISICVLTVPLFSAKFVTIGTGEVTGVYYPTGEAICKIANKIKKETKIRCSVELTNGSVYNIDGIKNSELDFAIVQSDVVYEAYNGEGNFKKPYRDLRTIITIYPELLTFVVRKDSEIKTLLDIKDKTINIGHDGSGQKNTIENLFSYSKKLNLNILKESKELEATELPIALGKKEIDGYFYVVGHPTTNIKDAANQTNIDLIEINEKSIENFETFLKDNPYYTVGVIPKGLYKGVDHDTKTFGVKATLVTNSSMPDELVVAILKAIIENFEDFKTLHPSYGAITKESLIENLGAPQHKAAKEYFKTIGLIKE